MGISRDGFCLMILAIDVDYRGTQACVAAIEFQDWADEIESGSYLSYIENIAEYVPGEFYRRELPCILKVIEEHNLSPEIIVIDGYVWLDGESAPGLGARLYEALDHKVPIIGVAKKCFKDISMEHELFRGVSKKPLYVTSVGIDFKVAKQNIENMNGNSRLPVLLKKVDRLCRQS